MSKVFTAATSSTSERRKKVLVRLSLVLLLLVAYISIFLSMVNKPTLEEKVEWVIIKVQHGETLWNIVSDAQKERNSVDIRELIDLTKQENNLGQYVYAGQEIKVPVYVK